MPPIIAGDIPAEAGPDIYWSVHVLAPYALIKNIDPDKDDIEGDDSYFRSTSPFGEDMVTEWCPKYRQDTERAIASIPKVFRQSWHYVGIESINYVLDEIEATEMDHDSMGNLVSDTKSPCIPQCVQQQILYEKRTNCTEAVPPIPIRSKIEATIGSEPSTGGVVLLKTVILNFVDGMESDGWPGISVIRELERRHLAFTGADSYLYYLDSDKAWIKRHLVETQTSTPGYFDVYSSVDRDQWRAYMGRDWKRGDLFKSIDDESAELARRLCLGEQKGEGEGTVTREKDDSAEDEYDRARKATIIEALSKLTFPLLVKPANASSSRGLSTKSVVDTPEEGYVQAMKIKKIWGPVYAEEYITGREYTALVTGSKGTGVRVYNILERVFRSSIPERERLLTHDMKWGDNNYGLDETVSSASWWMQICSDEDQTRLQPIARDIYVSFGGNGYCRMDLREDQRTGKVYVVDVNTNCSVDGDENCAMGKILKSSGLSLSHFFEDIIHNATLARESRSFKATECNNIFRSPISATAILKSITGAPTYSQHETVPVQA